MALQTYDGMEGGLFLLFKLSVWILRGVKQDFKGFVIPPTPAGLPNNLVPEWKREVCVCVCVCVHARARACVCVCVCVRAHFAHMSPCIKSPLTFSLAVLPQVEKALGITLPTTLLTAVRCHIFALPSVTLTDPLSIYHEYNKSLQTPNDVVNLTALINGQFRVRGQDEDEHEYIDCCETHTKLQIGLKTLLLGKTPTSEQDKAFQIYVSKAESKSSLKSLTKILDITGIHDLKKLASLASKCRKHKLEPPKVTPIP